MAMPFWPSTDYARVVTLFDNLAQDVTESTTGWAGLYDPNTTFDAPAVTADPENPATFATWGFDSHLPTPTLDPDTAGSRQIFITIAFFTERGEAHGSVGGYARDMAAEYFRELQDATNHPAGIDFIPQTMLWTEPPGRPDPDWIEAQMRIELLSQ